MKAEVPHPVAVMDSPQWLRTFAMQFKGETSASLELCATRLDALGGAVEAMKMARDFMPAYGRVAEIDAAISKAEGRA